MWIICFVAAWALAIWATERWDEYRYRSAAFLYGASLALWVTGVTRL